MLYYGTRISDNICKKPEGYLVCKDVPIARIGKQKYLGDEIGLTGKDRDAEFDVNRPEDEVFSEATIASFEGMPVTDDHPEDPVNAENIHLYQKGHVQNVHRGSGKESDMLIADLIITDPHTVQEVLDGKREISCGYDYNMDDSDGQYTQRQIRGNHVAIVDRGRAGHRVCIKDSAPDERRKSKVSKRAKIFSKMFASYAKDEDVTPEEVADAAEEIQAVAVEEPEDTAPKSAGDEGLAPAPDKLDTIIEMLGRLLGKGQDEEPEVVAEEEEVTDEGEEVDPLQKLEDDLTELEAMRSEEEEDEEPEESASNFVDPEEINESEDEDPEVEEMVEEEEKVTDKKGCDSLRVAIDALKPIIASLPASQRKKASDAAAKSLRKSMGMDAKPTKNGYAKLNSAKKRSVDSAVNEKNLAKTIMEKRNPNYKK